LRQVTQALLHAGAPIHDINTVRKHLTRLSGGQLARASGKARGRALIISDVVGDDPSIIASGPCTPDPTTCSDALDRLAHFRIALPRGVQRHLETCSADARGDTPKPGDPCFSRMENRVIGSAHDSLMAAVRVFEQHGIPALLISDSISGDAQVVARQHAALAHARLTGGPLALISGGETTVTLRPQHGRGGRNSEYLLALALALRDNPAWPLPAITDGIRRQRRQCRCAARPGTRLHVPGRSAFRQKSCWAAHDSHGFLFRAGRPGRYRPHPHQRQRLPALLLDVGLSAVNSAAAPAPGRQPSSRTSSRHCRE